MAINQFSIDLVPREPIVGRFGTVPTELPDEDDDWLWVWQPPADYRSVIEAFTHPYPSWSPDIRMWGSENGDRIHVIHERERVVGIACRLDVRRFSGSFASGLLHLTEHCDCLLLMPGSRLVQPTREALVAAIRASDELRFVTDPVGFFNGLSSGELKPQDIAEQHAPPDRGGD